VGWLALIAFLVLVVRLLVFGRRAFTRLQQRRDDLRRADEEPSKQPPSAMKDWGGKF
jgi:membrane protein implicated in regulation of membrane protease activity